MHNKFLTNYIRNSFWYQHNTGAKHGKRDHNLRRSRDCQSPGKPQTLSQRHRNPDRLEKDQDHSCQSRDPASVCGGSGCLFGRGYVSDHGSQQRHLPVHIVRCLDLCIVMVNPCDRPMLKINLKIYGIF